MRRHETAKLVRASPAQARVIGLSWCCAVTKKKSVPRSESSAVHLPVRHVVLGVKPSPKCPAHSYFVHAASGGCGGFGCPARPINTQAAHVGTFTDAVAPAPKTILEHHNLPASNRAATQDTPCFISVQQFFHTLLLTPISDTLVSFQRCMVHTLDAE